MNHNADGELLERELPAAMDQGVLAVISKAEIDVQIATAHRFPRSVKAFRDEALALVTLTEDIAEECIYALPRDGKTIEGPSARFAEVIASAWGNSRAGARVVDDSGEFVTAQGAFHDLQKNVAITYEVKRRIVDKHGRRFKPDMVGVTANAACSIALRNAILKGVPKALWSSIYEAARKTVMGDYQTLANRRAAALAAFQKFGVTPERVYEKLAIRGEEDITLEHLVVLRGLLTALKEGDTTVEESFPAPRTAGDAAEGGAASRLKQAVGAGEQKPASAPAAATATAPAPVQSEARTPYQEVLAGVQAALNEPNKEKALEKLDYVRSQVAELKGDDKRAGEKALGAATKEVQARVVPADGGLL